MSIFASSNLRHHFLISLQFVAMMDALLGRMEGCIDPPSSACPEPQERTKKSSRLPETPELQSSPETPPRPMSVAIVLC